MIKIKRNDTAPVLRAEVRNAAQEPIYLTSKNPIKFIMRENFYYDQDKELEEIKVLESDNVVLSPQESNRGRFQYLWQPGDTDTAGQYLAEFEILLNGVECDHYGPFALVDGDTLSISIDQGSTQDFTFSASAFADIGRASAQEIADVINATLTGGVVVVTDGGRRLLLQSNKTDLTGSSQVTGGTSNDVIGFDTEIYKNSKISLPQMGIRVVISEDIDAL